MEVASVNQLEFPSEEALNKFDEIYSGKRPGFLDGYKKLKEQIIPWGA